MSHKLFLISLAVLASFGAIYGIPVKPGADKKPLVFMSLDGFRWDYLNKYGDDLPTFSALRDGGSTVPNGLINSFITKTFPNHRTLMTGLYEESHGIVANHFWDPNLNETFSLSSLDINFWNQSLPLWTLAEQNGVTAGCFQYPGCGVKEQMPTYILADQYIPDLTFQELVVNVSAAFHQKINPPKFIAMYFWEPDNTGHKFGPDSPEMRQKLIELDGGVKFLLESLGNDFNFIFTSDHGFSQFSKGVNTSLLTLRLQVLADHIFNNEVEFFIWPKDGKDEEVKAVLEEFAQANSDVQLYYKEDYLDRWHYKHNDRIAPIMMLLPDGHQFSYGLLPYNGGQHGYDNMDITMRPIFIANGPAFKENFQITETDVKNVDVYPLMCHMLNIEPLPNNGTVTSLLPILKDSQSEERENGNQLKKRDSLALDPIWHGIEQLGKVIETKCSEESCLCKVKNSIKKKETQLKKL